MRRPQVQNSNLFAIDFEAIENVLRDANAPLISAAEDLLDTGSLIQEPIRSNREADDLKDIVVRVREHSRQLSKARLSDGRPFTDASKLVKDWFGKTENRLKALDKRLSGLLASYTSNVAAEAEEIRRRNEDRERIAREAEAEVGNEEGNHIGSSLSGEPIVTVVAPPSRASEIIEVENEPEPEVPDVNLEWQVRSFDRDRLNPQEIFPYLTDNALKLAINAHIKDYGPNLLDGVEYEQIVARRL